MRAFSYIYLILGCVITFCGHTQTFLLPEAGGDIVGEIKETVIEPNDTLYAIARRNDVGLLQLQSANPSLKPRRLKLGATITIPTGYILPNAPKEGIVINLPELRLYYYPEGQNVVMTYPIGIGRPGWETPSLNSKIIEKQINPIWNVPKSISRYMAEKYDIYLDDAILPGPDNPLGRYAMRLGSRSYLIHGTNRPDSVGQRSSSGCIRMYPENIEILFQRVPLGTPVTIVDQPYKVGWQNDRLYLEAHKPLEEASAYVRNNLTITPDIEIKASETDSNINWDKVAEIVKHKIGIPLQIGGKW